MLLILFACIICSCSENHASYYFYHSTNDLLKKDTMGTILSYSILKPVYTSWSDSIKIEISNKGYFLMHHLENNGEHGKDSTFVRHKSFLDSIEVFDSVWFQEDNNLKNFWDPSQYLNDGASDSLRIYVIEPSENSDSLIVRRVHRFYMPGREG